ncbi:MAG: four helix bundle protein, partial [Candidatus Parcubacteria bacterium]|nr:four helix bundle protein [Candidatus Parcubacteria bacterium]
MLQDLVIFQKTYDFILWLYPAVNKFPKSQRFVLGQQIENRAIQVLKDIIVANQEMNKATALKKTSVDLDELRILIRLSK